MFLARRQVGFNPKITAFFKSTFSVRINTLIRIWQATTFGHYNLLLAVELDSNRSLQYFHFVTIGLSDLYGDGRVRFPPFPGASGFGIELTMKGKFLAL